MAKREQITPVEITHQLRKSLGLVPLYEDSRWYVHQGDLCFHDWLSRLMNSGINILPLQHVSQYVGASRESVLKRAKNGGLTVFSFGFSEYTTNFLGRKKVKATKKRVDFVPISECQQWREILIRQINQREKAC